ncbi:MAG: GNAT family N-acetyltransferase [Cyanobacteria bacterium SBLK]|nr:GNAT family N-acetyltransferase [Cyanobacteria bacterium SBLK]
MDEAIFLEQTHKATGLSIVLTSIEEKHIQHLILLARDRDLIDLMGWDTFFELEDTEKFIQNISTFVLPYSRDSQPLVLGIYLEQTSPPIGYAVLKGINRDLLTAEVGIAILDRKHRNRGYGRLALQRMTIYAFSELSLQTIGSTILLSNRVSINMCKRVGFSVREIMAESWSMPNGEIVDMVWMELTKEAWLKREKKKIY